jgi:hypothetical protein
MSNGGTPAAGGTPSIRSTSTWRDHRFAITVAALGGALILGTGILLIQKLVGETGDEPPIRVKNGSLELRLETAHHNWQKGADARHWEIKNKPQRGNAQFAVTVAVTPGTGASCTAQALSGDSVAVTYNNGSGKMTTVTIKTDGDRHSQVESSEDLTVGPNSKDRLLLYGATGFISGILVGSTPMCTFTDAKQLTNLVILDYWQ